MHCRIDQPVNVSCDDNEFRLRITHQSHNLPNRALNMQHLGALNPNKAPLASKLREKDIGAIHFHHLPHLVEAIKQYIVNLVTVDNNIFDIDLDSHDKFPQFLLGSGDLLGCISGNVDLVLAAAMGTWRGIAENTRERWWEIDRGACRSFDELDVLPSPPTDQGMHGQLQLHSIHVTFELVSVSEPVNTIKKFGDIRFDQS